jgi:hypothetical protein
MAFPVPIPGRLEPAPGTIATRPSSFNPGSPIRGTYLTASIVT